MTEVPRLAGSEWSSAEIDDPWTDTHSDLASWGDDDISYFTSRLDVSPIPEDEGGEWLVRFRRDDLGVAFVAAGDRELVELLARLVPIVLHSRVLDLLAGVADELKCAGQSPERLLAAVLHRQREDVEDLTRRQNVEYHIQSKARAAEKAKAAEKATEGGSGHGA